MSNSTTRLLDTPSDRRTVVLQLHKDGMAVEEIAYHVPIAKIQIYDIIKEFSGQIDR